GAPQSLPDGETGPCVCTARWLVPSEDAEKVRGRQGSGVESRSAMQVGLLLVAFISGLATVVFIVSGLRQAQVQRKTLGRRALVLTTVFSLLTGVFTIWQLVLVAQHLPLAP